MAERLASGKRATNYADPPTGRQTCDIGSKTDPSGHAPSVCAGVAAGAGLAAATPPPKNSPPSTAVAASERMITSRIMFPTLSGTPLVAEHIAHLPIPRTLLEHNIEDRPSPSRPTGTGL